ncbi:MAG: thioredoxin family protein [Candidatus Eisenbacteria bacterium]|nr:thioredoxin family protein [Candidatus Eisenbacteria bacterium]
MKRIATLALVAGLSLAAAAASAEDQAPQSLAIGAAAPMTDVKMLNVDGKSLTLADVKGARGTLVVFTCNHCPWAQAWTGRIVELGNMYAKKGIGVVAINPNDPNAYGEDSYDAMQARAKDKGMQFPYVVDATSDLARAFGASRTPEAFLFDAKGKLVYHGAIDDNAKEPEKVTARWLHDALEATVAGKAVAVKESKSMGCGIKFRAKVAAATSSS